MDISSLKKLENVITPTVRIGKKGLTIGLINDINLQLKKRGIIKIKVLRNFFDEENLIEVSKKEILNSLISELEKVTKGKVLSTRGNTILLYNPFAKKYLPLLRKEKEN
ncbi:MAG: YhbY family RNA-binding protein [Candidatus Woesearchaeota archaeon]